jgi:hypothetical protein
MGKEEQEGGGGYLNAKDMRDWAQREIKDLSKASELRLRELTGFVAAYSAGEITPEKADELQSRYYHRWGEALPGHSASEGVTDEQILTGIDQAAEAINGPFTAPAEIRARYVDRLKGKGGPPHRNS